MAIDPSAIGRLVEDIADELVEWRRRLHQNPELSFEEVETSRFVYETLESFVLAWSSPGRPRRACSHGSWAKTRAAQSP